MSSRSKFRATQAIPLFPGTSELMSIPDREIFTVPTSPLAFTPSPFPSAVVDPARLSPRPAGPDIAFSDATGPVTVHSWMSCRPVLDPSSPLG